MASSCSLPPLTILHVVEELLPYPLYPHNVAAFSLIVPPTRLLEMGSTVELHLVSWPSNQQLPATLVNHIDIYKYAQRIDIAGKIVAIRAYHKDNLELVMENWYPDAAIKRAYLCMPNCPGVTVRDDLWASITSHLPRLIEIHRRLLANNSIMNADRSIEHFVIVA
ncbi:hypothetical protein OH77DRAFT_1593553 [Trametes cingulata]|nr:hypothetical protein OH77DRAFT_1593553 [Trametes cingulata]